MLGEKAVNSKVELAGPAGENSMGMDRQVAPKRQYTKTIVLMVAGLLGVVLLFLNVDSGRALNVNSERIQTSAVTRGTFEDFVPVRARVVPAKTLFLDAIEGGRVERVLVEDGAYLNAGDLIVELSNATLQLNVLSNEAQVAEQLNNMRSIELSLEQNRLQHKRNLSDLQYQIKMLTRQLQAEGTLLAKNSLSQSKYDDTRDTLDWYKERLALTLESQASDAKMQESQLVFLRETGKRLEDSLAISRENLESMNVRAPVAGKLSGFDVEIGQSIGRGERLGQIDTPNNYKLSALIDQFYLERVDIGQGASYDGYKLTISKVYPQVKNGQFEVDLTFNGEQPNTIRRGQTLQLKLMLGDASEALLIPNGAFYQETGGQWIFVVSANGADAVKRQVRLGRRNSQFIEVIEGLDEGERVVTSTYSDYQNLERLNLTDND